MTAPATAVRPTASRRPSLPRRRPGDDPWQWHEYATWIARLEGAAWDRAAEAVDRAPAEVRALVALRPGGRAVGVLGGRLGLTSGGATKLCRRLCDLGLIERRAVDHDQRGVEVVLTACGRDIADRAAGVYADCVAAGTAQIDLAAAAPTPVHQLRPITRAAVA